MLLSMTGFGKKNCETNGKKITIEIKSLNSKVADVSVKLPLIYREKETEIRNEITKILERGKIEVCIYYEIFQNNKSTTINKEAFAKYFNQLKEIKNEYFPNEDNNWINVITSFPDIFIQKSEEIDETEWIELSKNIKETADILTKYRTTEGKELESKILGYIRNIENLHESIDKYEKLRIEEIKTRIKDNLNDLFKSEDLDNNRFEQELIYYIERIDFTEERTRLKNHCNYFKETCNEKNSGRKLGFIAQEIGREINTLGSKAYNSEIQKIVVQMKDELEKIKEQLLNIL